MAGRLLWAWAPPALPDLRASAADPMAPALSLLTSFVSALAWLVLCWLAVVALSWAWSALPGRVGAAGALVRMRVTPAVVRRVAEVGLGVTLAGAGALGTATPGWAQSSAAPRVSAQGWHGQTSTSPGTPGESAVQPPLAALPSLDWPATPTPDPPTPVGLPAPEPTERAVPAPSPARGPTSPRWTVRPGDTLWEMTSHALGPGAGDALVARWWPRYWAENRRVIGPDPDLIRPGERLVFPPPGSPALSAKGHAS